MYKIVRSNTRIIVKTWNGEIIYSCEPGDWIVYRPENETEVSVARVDQITDEKLLRALSTAVKFCS